MSKDQLRKERKVNQLLQEESRWLQKVMFGLNKVRDARAALTEVRDKAPAPIPWSEPDNIQSIEGINEALTARVEYLVSLLKERRQKLA